MEDDIGDEGVTDPNDDAAKTAEEIETVEDNDMIETTAKQKIPKKRKSEIEKLKIEDWKGPKNSKRTRSSHAVINNTDDQQFQDTVRPMFNLINVAQSSQMGEQVLGEPGHQGHAGLQGGCVSDQHEGFDSSAVLWEKTLFGLEIDTDLDENEPIYLM